MKRKIVILISLLFLIVNLSSCGIMSKKYSKSDTSEFIISTTGKSELYLDNINGDIKIFKSNDSGFVKIIALKEVRVKKKYRDTPFDEIKVNIDTTGNTIAIKTEMKKSKGDFIKFDFHKSPYVDYEIWVPDNLEIKIDNVNGKIIADTLSNSISIHNVNGDVDLGKSSGMIVCEIINGNFNASADSTIGISVKIVNGKVNLLLSNVINADFDISTLNGSINYEQINFREMNKEKKRLRGKSGTLHENLPVIKLETVNGKINLLGKTEI
jgi:hypothetical protein